MRKMTGILVAAAIALLLGGCAGKQNVSGDHATAKRYSHLLFVGAYDDSKYRVSAEKTFVAVLQGKGIDASVSYKLLPGLKNVQNNTEVSNKLKGTEYDGMLVVSILENGYDYNLNNFHASKGFVYLLDGRPRRPAERGSFLAWAGTGDYLIYAGLWDVKTLRPVWQITTDSKSTGSDKKDNELLAEVIAEALQEKGLVDAKKP